MVRYDPERTFSLADVAASTGAAPQLQMLTGDPSSRMGALLRAASGVLPAFTHYVMRTPGDAPSIDPPPQPKLALSEEIPHGDGGFSDNIGLMPLLARQVTNIAAFVNTSQPYPEANRDIRSFFTPLGPPDGGGDKRYSKVFHKARYDELIDGLRTKRDDPDAPPLVYCDTGWEVLKNPRYNIQGYKGLNICWFYNYAPEAWKKPMHPDVRAVVEGRDPEAGNFERFPWLSTFLPNRPTRAMQMSVAQVNLLSNLTAWVIVHPETAGEIRETLGLPMPP